MRGRFGDRSAFFGSVDLEFGSHLVKNLVFRPIC